MPRRGKAFTRRVIQPDGKYQNEKIARFINKIMLRGKKSTAEIIVYSVMDILREETKKDPVEVFEQALKNATPLLAVRARRIGGATYQVPTELTPARGQALAMRWLIDSARSRKGKPMAEKLAAELIEASRGEGAAVKKQVDTHRMAEANRAFAHYRW